MASTERFTANWERLAEFRAVDVAGWTRVAYSDADTASRHFVADLMRSAGMSVRIDSVGNVIGELIGADASRGVLATGSHTDTVAGGGRFDGIVGVLGAVEAVVALREAGVRLQHTLRVVDFASEETNPQGLSCVGSRAVSGSLTAEMLDLVDVDGVTLHKRIAAAGWGEGIPDLDAVRWPRGEVSAFVELHVEQGPMLEQRGASIGIVTGIAGIERFVARIAGRVDHAGTMPMDQRRDAACGAASTVLAVQQIAAAGSGAVGTCGEITVTPDAFNVVADRATVSGEFRSPDDDWLASARADLARHIEAADNQFLLRTDLQWLPGEPVVHMADTVAGHLRDAAAATGHQAIRVFSGAGHDTMQLALLCPTGMIFIPSTGGRSHCPEENTPLPDITAGVEVLAHAIVELDTRC